MESSEIISIFEKILRDSKKKWMPLNELGNAFRQWTGKPFKKVCKGESLESFLRNSDTHLQLDDRNRVFIQEGTPLKRKREDEEDDELSSSKRRSTSSKQIEEDDDEEEEGDAEVEEDSESMKEIDEDEEEVEEGEEDVEEAEVEEGLEEGTEGVEGESKSNSKASKTSKKIPYTRKHDILLVGEGDFSFAASLRQLLPSPLEKLFIATTFESESEAHSKYPNAKKYSELLKKNGCTVLYNVDATKLHISRQKIKALNNRFDRIIFNFPFSGVEFDGQSYKASIQSNQLLLRKFFESSSKLLKKKGQIHVTLKNTEPYLSWDVLEQARVTNRVRFKNYFPFDHNMYPFYQHVKTNQSVEVEEGVHKKRATETKIERNAYTFTFCLNDGKTSALLNTPAVRNAVMKSNPQHFMKKKHSNNKNNKKRKKH